MDILNLAQEIIHGKRLTREDDLSFFLTCDLEPLCQGADEIRKACVGDKVDLCSIINGRSGRCPEDCKYCAQSAHYHTECDVYDFLPEEAILEACKMNESEGVDRFSIVTAGRALTGEEFDQAIHAYETMHRECKIDLCASMGFLSAEQLHRLHKAGVTSYHHNIETSKRNFPNICTTHTYDMKVETLKKVKAEGMCACSGGIIGMGETWEDRLDMAVSLAELGIDSIPINALMPIPGTPLEHLPRLTEQDILRTIAFFRYINPEANIRLAAGRALLTNDGDLLNALTHPRHEVEKHYEVRVRGNLDNISKLAEPMEIDGYSIRPATVVTIDRDEISAKLRLTIHEGRNRQIRKMCEKCGLEVRRLKRVAMGTMPLDPHLKSGAWRELTNDEIAYLQDIAADVQENL